MTKRFGFTLAGATHVDMQQKTVKNAFTLAEVLITLGIIGVVAAMTMPTLMNSTQGAQYKAAYKKALSALSQAVTLNVALDEYNFADLDNSTYNLEEMLNNRMNVVRTEKATFNAANNKPYSVQGNANGGATTVTAPGADNTTLFFNDGIMFTYTTASTKGCSIDPTVVTGAGGSTDKYAKACRGFIDVNGIKAPNKLVKCENSDYKVGANEKCTVSNPTDVCPVIFYDQTIMPNSAAARAVLYSK